MAPSRMTGPVGAGEPACGSRVTEIEAITPTVRRYQEHGISPVVKAHDLSGMASPLAVGVNQTW